MDLILAAAGGTAAGLLIGAATNKAIDRREQRAARAELEQAEADRQDGYTAMLTRSTERAFSAILDDLNEQPPPLPARLVSVEDYTQGGRFDV